MSGLYYHAFEDKRILEDSNVADNSGNSTVCSDLAGSNDAEVLRNTMRLYGGIFLLIFVAFCFLRRRFPRVYNLRNWVEGITTDLASDTRGGMAWAWKLFAITDFEMMDECGMDALCYTRVLEFGMKLSIVGILNALWLIPVYATAKPDEVTTCVTDWVGKISVSHLAAGSYRFCATVVGAYVVFGYAMYTILQEFQWFSRYRHKFLAKTLPRNYCVYVQCIPQEYRSDQKLFDFFQQTSSLGSVLEARLAIKTPNLQKKVAERNVLVAKLEHAINLEEIQGVTLMQRRGGVIGTSLPLINVLLRQLEELNQIIAESIDRMQRVSHGLPPIPEGYTDMTSIHTLTLDHPSTVTGHENYGTTEDQVSCSAHTVENNTIGPSTTESVITSETEERPTTVNTATNLLFSNAATTSLKNSFHSAANAAGTVANAAATLLNSQDGEPLSAGFVTFKSLRAAQAAKQMIQYSEPFAMEVLEAPHPEGKMNDVIIALCPREAAQQRISRILFPRCVLEECRQDASRASNRKTH